MESKPMMTTSMAALEFAGKVCNRSASGLAFRAQKRRTRNRFIRNQYPSEQTSSVELKGNQSVGDLTAAGNWITKNYPKTLSFITTIQQIALERRYKDENTRIPNKIMTARLRLGFVPQWRTTEEDACQLLLSNVVYCSENLVAFNKPPGIAVQDGAGLSYSIDSLSDRLLFLLKKTGRFKRLNAENVPNVMKVVHRLDQDVSGAIVFGLNEYTTDLLNEKFKTGQIEKKYWCLCVGQPQNASESGVIALPLHSHNLCNGKTRMKCRSRDPVFVPDQFGSCDSSEIIIPHRSVENIVRTYSKSEAITKYSMLASGIESCLLELDLVTGKKHQARVHCAEALGCPILGDHKYHHSNKIAPQTLPSAILQAFNIKQSMARHLPLHLHAKSLVIPDMVKGRKLYINTRLPVYFTANMRRLEIYNV